MKKLLFILLLANIFMSPINRKIQLIQVKNNVWIHLSYAIIDGSEVPSNGLFVTTSEGIILIDTPWDDAQTKTLLDMLNNKFHKKILYSVVTHAHDDRIGGIAELLKHNIKVVASILTKDQAIKHHFKTPTNFFVTDTVINKGTRIELYYPGAGHTIDNIVVFVPEQKVLYGGCLIKGKDAKDLGNIAEADISAWDSSVGKVLNRFQNARFVIPGHGDYGDKELMLNTIRLVKEYRVKK